MLSRCKLKESYYTLFLQVNLVPWCPNEMSVTCFDENTIRMKQNSSSNPPTSSTLCTLKFYRDKKELCYTTRR